MQYIKTLICFFWLVLLTSAAQAEDHKVYIESFTHEPMDQSAKKASEMDGDGDLYAIVKVRPSSKNFQISFGAMSCKVQGEHDGETWLFVQKNASIISIRRDGFTPIINKGLGMNIQAGETYILNLSYVEPRFSQQKQYLKFNVSPREESATVKVKRDGDADYEIWGQTSDGTIARLLECGKYQYQIWAENYERVEGQVMLNQPDETYIEQVSLQANFGYLEVGDAYGISGARIYIDDKPVGTIPYKNKWPAGKYRLSVTGELFKTYNQTFEIKKGETTVLHPNPESNSAEILFHVDADADIYVDKKWVGNRKWQGPLGEGFYEVECRIDERYRPTRTTIHVEANKSQEVVLEAPEPMRGSVSIFSNPLDADILIDGDLVGKTPKIVSNLMVGKHTVTLSHDNYKIEEREIEIEDGKTIELNVPLSDVAMMTIRSNPSGADLWINNQYKGVTPYSEVLPSGEHQLVLKKKGYRKKIDTVFLKKDSTLYYKPRRVVNGVYCSFGSFWPYAECSASGEFGLFINNINLELRYDSGIDDMGANCQGIGIKAGFAFPMGKWFSITPQSGLWSVNSYDKSIANFIVSTRFQVGAHRRGFALFVCPEYAFSEEDEWRHTEPKYEYTYSSKKIVGYYTADDYWQKGFMLRFGLTFIWGK